MNNRVNLSGQPLPLPLLFILTDFSKDSIKPDVVRFWSQIRVFDYFGHSHRHVGQGFKNISQSPLFRALTQYLRGMGEGEGVRREEIGPGLSQGAAILNIHVNEFTFRDAKLHVPKCSIE